MKKLLLSLLTLALAVCLCGCSALAIGITDPVLERVDAQGIPQGVFSDLGNGRILIWNMEDGMQVIHDLRTGRTIPVTAREEDKDHWITSLFAAYAAEGILLSVDDIAVLEKVDAQTIFDECNKFIGGMQIYSCGRQYALVLNYSAVLGVDTGVTAIIPHTEYSLSMTMWDQMLGTEINSREIICFLIGEDGREQYRAVLSEEGYTPMSVCPVEDGVVAFLLSRDSSTKTSMVSFILLDWELNTRAVVRADGGVTKHSSIKQAYSSPETGRLLLLTQGKGEGSYDRKTFRFTPDGPYLDGLLVVDLQSQTCTRVGEELENMRIAGMAADGSYALIATEAGHLYKLDMRTLILSLQMTPEETAAAGLSAADMLQLSWDGGEYAVGTRSIFRIRER